MLLYGAAVVHGDGDLDFCKAETLTDHTSNVDAVAWSHDSSQLATTGYGDLSVIVYNTSTWEIAKILSEHTSWRGYAVAWSHDSSQLAVGLWDGSVVVYDTSTWNIVKTLTDHTGFVMSVAWSHDSSQLATASGATATAPAGAVIVYDTPTWNIVKTLTDHTSGNVHSLAWSHDSSQLATASGDTSVIVYDTSTWVIAKTLTDHTGTVNWLAWSHDSSQLATSSDDYTAIVYDTSTWEIVNILTLKFRVHSVAWSHDSLLLAATSGSVDRSVIVYDTSTWDIAKTIMTAHPRFIRALAWSHDSSQLATSSWKTVIVYDINGCTTAATSTATAIPTNSSTTSITATSITGTTTTTILTSTTTTTNPKTTTTSTTTTATTCPPTVGQPTTAAVAAGDTTIQLDDITDIKIGLVIILTVDGKTEIKMVLNVAISSRGARARRGGEVPGVVTFSPPASNSFVAGSTVVVASLPAVATNASIDLAEQSNAGCPSIGAAVGGTIAGALALVGLAASFCFCLGYRCVQPDDKRNGAGVVNNAAYNADAKRCERCNAKTQFCVCAVRRGTADMADMIGADGRDC